MNYTISIHEAETHFLALTFTIPYVHQDTLHLQLPSWRPGRYELQNYAKNIRCFMITDADGQTLPFRKLTKDRWEVDTRHTQTVIVSYQYYANQYDAGASFVNGEMMYVNPVNCLLYVEGRMDEEYTINLILPNDYKIACQLPISKHTLKAPNFDLLADSPWIASATLTHETIELDSKTEKGNSILHFWFQGEPCPDMKKLMDETVLYANEQVALFGEFPCSNYHFLYHVLPTVFRHGVEHLDSTVIAMGPSSDWNNPSFYDSFMAISSHELFHLWNVKRIRPNDMLPYDFTKENYSTLGYIYEGVTTYYGDMILLRSGVWSWEQYTESFASDFKRHINNEGRFNYSVAESSFDTWLDGYVTGVPERKVSIYIEGMLAACIADILIIHHSNGQYSLDNIMRDLYDHFYKKGKGYTEQDYIELLEKYSGISFKNYCDELLWGKGYFDKWLHQTFDLIGCSLDIESAQLLINTDLSNEQQVNFTKWTQSRFAPVAKKRIFEQPK